jgi:hypothetical protein
LDERSIIRTIVHAPSVLLVTSSIRKNPHHTRSQTKPLKETKQMLRDTLRNWATPDRQEMRPLPKEPVEILRYALSELEQTMCPETPSIVHVRHTLIEGITFLETEAAR